MASFLAGQVPTAAELILACRSGETLARGRRVSTSSNTSGTTLLAVQRIDDIPITAGRLYRIQTTPLYLDTDTNNDVVRAVVTYTTDGSTPTISSTQLVGGACNIRLASAADPEHSMINTTYTPAGDETFSLLLTIARSTGAGVERLIADSLQTIEFTITDCGVDPGDTGVDL